MKTQIYNVTQSLTGTLVSTETEFLVGNIYEERYLDGNLQGTIKRKFRVNDKPIKE